MLGLTHLSYPSLSKEHGESHMKLGIHRKYQEIWNFHVLTMGKLEVEAVGNERLTGLIVKLRPEWFSWDLIVG